jgi:hypothetical protein
VERTYDRSFAKFVVVFKAKGSRKG